MKDQPDAFDVIVVGGGGSGLAAACRVAGLGGRVVVLEKQPQLGGTTGIAVGSFTSSGASLQRQAGITDDPAAPAEDAARFAPPEIEARNNAPLRDWFLTEAAATFEWLGGLGKVLNVLALDQTKVTDAGLKELEGFERLSVVSLRGTQVTDAGVAALRRARGKCQINR
jgi:glycine/D-amino acid oxidase-like deaminating enzyme